MKKLELGALKADGTAYSAEEIKAHNDFIALVESTSKELTADLISKEDATKQITDAIEKATGELKAIIEKQKETLIKQGTTIQGLKVQGSNTSAKTTKEILADELTANKDAIDRVINSKGSAEIVLKANYTRASVTSTTQAEILNTIGQLGTRRLTAYDLFDKVPVSPESNGIIRYTDWDESTTVRAAATISEGGIFPESTATFREYTLPLEKIGDTIPITEEAMKDTPRLAAEIERFLEINVNIVQDTQLVSGTGASPQLKGLYTTAPTFTAVASGIADANIFDLLVKMSEGITTARGSKYAPNFAMLNIKDINKMKLKKDTTNNYIMPPFTMNNGQVVDGMTIIENNILTQNTLVMGDSRFGTIYELEGYTLSFDAVGTQFVNDLVTMKARKRMALLMRTVDQTGFLKCTSISAALVTLAT